MRKIVVSGINLFRGGTLKIMQDCIASLSAFGGNDYEIVALVHNENQYAKYPNVSYISYPQSRKSWLFRLYYEYIGFKKLSRRLKPYCWFSLHDTTPNVSAEKRMVYCHNTFSFYHARFKDLFVQPEIVMFSLFSRYIHKTNIRKNDYVVVQQEWLRQAFKQLFLIDNVVVSLPVQPDFSIARLPEDTDKKNEKTVFFYPSTPMIHKNYEVICKAAAALEKSGIHNFEVVLTFDGSENKYAGKIHDKYKSVNSLRFVGFLTREEVDRYYHTCNCLLFPSKIESWGLPVSEAKEYGKVIMVSDLPYAGETVGKYDKAKFFDPDDVDQLTGCMKDLIQGNLVYDQTTEINYEAPFTRNWDELIQFLFK
ncbi:hypothetical protein AGMMS50239_26160 [Bacteroidia bacterium]|nr:hypothetical protein AGMMS50239_26160 [Bacteroidia bacterium]